MSGMKLILSMSKQFSFLFLRKYYFKNLLVVVEGVEFVLSSVLDRFSYLLRGAYIRLDTKNFGYLMNKLGIARKHLSTFIELRSIEFQ